MGTEAAQILDQGTKPEVAQPLTPTTEGSAQPIQEQVSPKMQVLIERERVARQAELSAKQEREALKAELAKLNEFQEAKKGNYKKALELLGTDYNGLSESILKDGEIPPSVEIKRLREELEHYKGQQKQEKDAELEQRKKYQAEQEQKAISDYKAEISTFLKDNSARYELIDFEQAQELVFDVIDEHYNRTIDQTTGVGKVMSLAEASDKVEEHLEKKYQAAKDKTKVKAFWGSIPKSAQTILEARKPNQALERQKPQTLTNNLSATPMKQTTRLPEDQRIAKILADYRAQKGA
jgi:hypothetical protein